MALRDDLVAIVDEARTDIVDDLCGLRLRAVQVRTKTWSGEPGVGTPTVDTVTLAPVPRVRPPTSRLQAAQPGVWRDGDLVVDRISATYSVTDLNPRTGGVEVEWLIDGEAYTVVREPEEKYLGWRVHLRRRAR